MKSTFFSLAGLIAATTAAIPAGVSSNSGYDDPISIQGLSVRKNNGIQAASFTIQPANATCAQTDAAALVYPRMTNCEGSLYYFQIKADAVDASKWQLTVTKEVGMNRVVNGTVAVPTYCHAGGNGVNDFVCSQISNASAVLTGPY